MSQFGPDFHHVHNEITLVLWFLVVSLAKIGESKPSFSIQVFHFFLTLHHYSALNRLEHQQWMKLPDSGLLLLVGTSFGAVLHFVEPDEEFYLKPEWFFLYLLPPIALDAGFFLPNDDFFHNFGTILSYAFVGTACNMVAISVTLYYLSGWLIPPQMGSEVGQQPPVFLEFLIFGTLISAVDPVAVLCVFEEVMFKLRL